VEYFTHGEVRTCVWNRDDELFQVLLLVMWVKQLKCTVHNFLFNILKWQRSWCLFKHSKNHRTVSCAREVPIVRNAVSVVKCEFLSIYTRYYQHDHYLRGAIGKALFREQAEIVIVLRAWTTAETNADPLGGVLCLLDWLVMATNVCSTKRAEEGKVEALSRASASMLNVR
jgi:hypothetical protein